MDDTVIAAMKSCLVKLKKDRRYMWCTCGKSAQQPFCDGSHKGTDFTPRAFTALGDVDALLCACKHTQKGPFCDGSHNNLSETYDESSGNVTTHARLVPFKAGVHGAQYARLDNIAGRVEIMDADKRSDMAGRFYQVLIDGEKQGTEVTQFIGHIPKSRAPHHKHIYEETITILSGEGYMWTNDTKSEVKAGDTIFLPLKQSHSLEATNTDGMLIVGVFFPSMSPAINY